MPSLDAVKNQALSATRQMLADSPSFRSMPLVEQKSLFKDVYSSQLAALQRRHGMRPRGFADPQKASDMIDDQRHLNQRIDQAGQLAGDFIDEVDFPQFVKDLLDGVFTANLNVTIKQMEAYQALLKAATASVSKFVNSIDDTAAFGYLAENDSDNFGLSLSDEKDENGAQKLQLTDSSGEPKDLGDNEVKARIMDAKIQMAREHRAILRETILMGITRLVVEKGVVKAACKFDIKATEQIAKNDKAALSEQVSTSTSLSGGGGFLGAIIGGPRAGHTRSTRKTKLSVSSAESRADTQLSASVTGSVEITFKSDYFKLDNFATMYGPGNTAGNAANAGGAPPGAPQQALPPAPVAAPRA